MWGMVTACPTTIIIIFLPHYVLSPVPLHITSNDCASNRKPVIAQILFKAICFSNVSISEVAHLFCIVTNDVTFATPMIQNSKHIQNRSYN